MKPRKIAFGRQAKEPSEGLQKLGEALKQEHPARSAASGSHVPTMLNDAGKEVRKAHDAIVKVGGMLVRAKREVVKNKDADPKVLQGIEAALKKTTSMPHELGNVTTDITRAYVAAGDWPRKLADDKEAAVESRKLWQALGQLKEYDQKLGLGLSDHGRAASHSSGLALALSVVANELNMPETEARLIKGGDALLKERGTGDVTKSTENTVQKITGYLRKLTSATDGDKERQAYQAISDIAFALSFVAKDLGKGHAESFLEQASSSARSGH